MFSWAHLGLVVLGGALGTAARAALTAAFADTVGILLVPAINVGGGFALGVLVGVLGRRAPSPRARAAQQFLGTGVLGGFSTYSALAVEGADPELVWIALGAALLGTLAAWAGLLVGRGRRRT